MSNYFDNQDKWSWNISEKEVLVTTDHGDHTHTLDITNVPIGEMVDNTGQVMGDAYRVASHDFKEDAGEEDNVLLGNREVVDMIRFSKTNRKYGRFSNFCHIL